MISSIPFLFCLSSPPPLPHSHTHTFIPSFSQSCFYSSPPVKGSYFCTVSRLLVFHSFHSIWTTFIFQLPDNNSSNNEVAWKQAISLSFLKDILLPFRKQTFCRTALLTTSVSETLLKGTDFLFRRFTEIVCLQYTIGSQLSKLTRICIRMTNLLRFWNSFLLC